MERRRALPVLSQNFISLLSQFPFLFEVSLSEFNQWEFRRGLLALRVGDGSLYMDFDTGIPMSRATVTEGPSSVDEGNIYLSCIHVYMNF